MPTRYDSRGVRSVPRWTPNAPVNIQSTSPPVIRENTNDYLPYESYPNELNGRPIKRCLSCRKVMYFDEYCPCLGRNFHEEMAKKRKGQRPRRKVTGNDSTGTTGGGVAGPVDYDFQLGLLE